MGNCRERQDIGREPQTTSREPQNTGSDTVPKLFTSPGHSFACSGTCTRDPGRGTNVSLSACLCLSVWVGVTTVIENQTNLLFPFLLHLVIILCMSSFVSLKVLFKKN